MGLMRSYSQQISGPKLNVKKRLKLKYLLHRKDNNAV